MKAPDFSNIEVEDYVDKYSEEGLWSKIRNNVTAIGIGLIYKALQLYYVASLPSVQRKSRWGFTEH